MSVMDHAEAHERIADLALEPGRLNALAASNLPEDEALLAHIAGCPDCGAEIASWRETHDALTGALRPAAPHGLEPAGAASVEPIRAPIGLRDGVLAVVRSPAGATLEIAPVAAVRRSRRFVRPALLGLAAALAIVIAGAGYRLQDERLQEAQAEQAALGNVTAALDRVLASEDFEVVALRRPDGTAAGSISWSRQDIVVLTTALEPPATGEEYRCWLENDGKRTPIGRMEYAGDVAFWAASLDEWATISIGSETRFGVSAEAVGGSGGSPAILEALLGS